jgi:hypothetical protein
MSSPTPFRSLLDRPSHPSEPAKAGGGKLLATLAIVGGGLLLLAAVGAAAGLWLVLSGPRFVPEELWEEQLLFVIEASVLPPGESDQILQEVRRLSQACEPRKMSSAQLEEVLTTLQQSPVFVLLDVGGIERDIVSASGLTDAEKEQARLAVRRAARGVQAGRIASGDFYAALPAGYFFPTQVAVALSDEDLWDYNSQFESEPPPASDADVRAALLRLKTLADQAQVSGEPWTFDVGDEFAKAVSGALAVAAQSSPE